jgi:naphtho-gamma-pyrone polyketide synthase
MSQYIDTRPLLQQVAETMGSYNLYIFGDLMLPFEEHLRRLLHIRDNETLLSFFAQIAFAFRHEFSKLPRSQQDWFPNFTTLVDLLSKLGQTDGTPALRFALLCVAQIGQFIGYIKKSKSHQFQSVLIEIS